MNRHPAVTYDYEPPKPYLGWSYEIDWGGGNSTFSCGYSTKEAAEADALETILLHKFMAGEEDED